MGDVDAHHGGSGGDVAVAAKKWRNQ